MNTLGNPGPGSREIRQGGRPSARRRLSILLLCDNTPGHANTLLDHIAAFRNYSAHDVRQFNPRGLRASRFLDLDEFDVVVIHYSLCIVVDEYLGPDFREKLRRFRGLKIQFVQDDYRWVDEIAAMMRYIGIDVLFTLVPAHEIPKVWTDDRLPGVMKINTLAGYVPEHLVGTEARPIDLRPIDIGYRGRVLPYWVGRLGQEKVAIAQGVLAHAEKYGLRCDIAWKENDRIYGQAWNAFLRSCKATLGTESGASITDFDGSIERRVRGYLAEHPAAEFEDVYREILQPFEGNVPMNVISPRIFEAIALHTPLILFPGEYSGVIQPWKHYIPLEKDFRNMDEVVERFRDTNFLQAMSQQAYRDIATSGRYSLSAFVKGFDGVVSTLGIPRARRFNVGFILARMETRAGRLTRIPPGRFRTAMLRCIPGRWRRPMERMVDTPGAFLRKGCVAWQSVVRVRSLREIFWRYVTSRDARGRIGLYQMMNDLLKLDLVRRARGGLLGAERRFGVVVDFHPETGNLTLTSQPLADLPPPAQGAPRPGDVEGAGDAIPAVLKHALFEGRVESIVWDHWALGRQIVLVEDGRRKLTVALDEDGMHRFEALTQLAQRHPHDVGPPIMAILWQEGTSGGDSGPENRADAGSTKGASTGDPAPRSIGK